MNKVACIIVNYNMEERAGDLLAYIIGKCSNVETIVVDNGSDNYKRTFSSIRLEGNVQTTNGWLMGMHYADALEQMYKGSFFAYWLLITSTEFVPESLDPLAPMLDFMEKNYNVVGVHPALTEDSTTSWDHLKTKGGSGFRETWMLDNICALWRADWFNSIGRFDPRLIFGWGVDLETSCKARAQHKKMFVCEDVKVKKVTDIGYTMNRMGMTAEERRIRARANMEEVFQSKYGDDWRNLMYAPGNFEFGGQF